MGDFVTHFLFIIDMKKGFVVDNFVLFVLVITLTVMSVAIATQPGGMDFPFIG